MIPIRSLSYDYNLCLVSALILLPALHHSRVHECRSLHWPSQSLWQHPGPEGSHGHANEVFPSAPASRYSFMCSSDTIVYHLFLAPSSMYVPEHHKLRSCSCNLPRQKSASGLPDHAIEVPTWRSMRNEDVDTIGNDICPYIFPHQMLKSRDSMLWRQR